MTTHYPTCEICAPLQGRVYSISGKDKRFPPLSQAFKNGYHNVHPNCRHSVHAWIEDLQDPEELQQALDDGGKPFEDLRPEEEKKLYNEQQSQNRRARDDRRQYERYKERLGEDAPKTFSAFRRMKKAGGAPWGVLEAQYKGMGYYQKAILNEPEITRAVLTTAERVGMTPAGLEFKIKSRDSFLRKIRDNYDPSGTEYEVKDIIRYTLTSPPDQLVDRAGQSIDAFSTNGYNTKGMKNYWLDSRSPYNGINSTLTAPSGQRFEVQYHTAESYALKNGRLHALYEKQRIIADTTSAEFIRLQNEMFELSGRLVVPDRIEELRIF